MPVLPTSKSHEAISNKAMEITPKTRLITSLTREKLLKNFNEALDLNIRAKQKFLKYEMKYYLKIGAAKKVDFIEKEMLKLPNVKQNGMKTAEQMTLDYNEPVIRRILSRIEDLQNEAERYLTKWTENKEIQSIHEDATVTKAPPHLSPYAAVSPRSPRKEHSNKQRSPPYNKHLSFSSSNKLNDSSKDTLLDEINFASAPIFDISGGSDRFSLGSKDPTNLLDWSPKLSKELSPPADAKNIQPTAKEEPESYRSSEGTSISTDFDELPLENDINEVKKEIQNVCEELWPKIQQVMNNETSEILQPSAFVTDADSDHHFHDMFKELIADTVYFESNKEIKKGIRYISVEQFTNRIAKICIRKLSIGCNNDLLDSRHLWAKRDVAFANVLKTSQSSQEIPAKEGIDFRKSLVCKAIQYDTIVKYGNEKAHEISELAYKQVCQFLKKHAPEKLEFVLSEAD